MKRRGAVMVLAVTLSLLAPTSAGPQNRGQEERSMKRQGAVMVLAAMLSLLAPTSAVPADDAKVKEGMSQVERGAKKIPSSQIADGVKETATGIGTTVSEGAEYSGEKLKDAGKATAAPARSAWGSARAGAAGVGHSLRKFFTTLFSN